MTASELEIIKADLLTANMIIRDSSGGANNPFMTNLAAYHSGQAIEKCLKSVIRDYGHLDEDLALSHSIEKLVLKAVKAVQLQYKYTKPSDNYMFITDKRYKKAKMK